MICSKKEDRDDPFKGAKSRVDERRFRSTGESGSGLCNAEVGFQSIWLRPYRHSAGRFRAGPARRLMGGMVCTVGKPALDSWLPAGLSGIANRGAATTTD